MDARVIKAFVHENTGILWRVGDEFTGDGDAARQLAERGYLQLGDESAPMVEAPAAADLRALTVAELRKLCAERGVDVPPKARKAQLVELLEG